MRKTVSSVGFLIPRSTYAIICGERPDSCATKYLDSLRPIRSSWRSEITLRHSAWAFRVTPHNYKRKTRRVHFTMVK